MEGNEGFWLAEVTELLQRRAPAMSDELALDTAHNILAAWPHAEPGVAVASFFHGMPLGFMRSKVTPAPLMLIEPREVAH